jgi:hypothetical protein
MCVSKVTKSRFVYKLADTGLFKTDLQSKNTCFLKLNVLNRFRKSQLLNSKVSIHCFILLQPRWKNVNFKDRHGFHYLNVPIIKITTGRLKIRVVVKCVEKNWQFTVAVY